VTVTVNVAVATFALESFAVQVTFVRPILKRLPETGWHGAATDRSTASCALTEYRTRTNFEFRGAVTDLGAAPLSTGRVRSNSMPGTTSVPVQASLATPRQPSTLQEGGST